VSGWVLAPRSADVVITMWCGACEALLPLRLAPPLASPPPRRPARDTHPRRKHPSQWGLGHFARNRWHHGQYQDAELHELLNQWRRTPHWCRRRISHPAPPSRARPSHRARHHRHLQPGLLPEQTLQGASRRTRPYRDQRRTPRGWQHHPAPPLHTPTLPNSTNSPQHPLSISTPQHLPPSQRPRAAQNCSVCRRPDASEPPAHNAAHPSSANGTTRTNQMIKTNALGRPHSALSVERTLRVPPWPWVGARLARPRFVTPGLSLCRLGGVGGRSSGCSLVDGVSPGDPGAVRQGQARCRRDGSTLSARPTGAGDTTEMSEMSVKS
jgi:hypothetical protein